MIFGAILAGGQGTRVGAKVPKQFIEINGRPILISTIDVFLNSNLFDVIYVSVNEMWLEQTMEFLDKFYDNKTAQGIRVVCGGKERIMSFLNIVKDIKEKHGVNNEDIVVSHDAVRPFVTYDILKDCIEKTKEFNVAMASIQSADTTYSSAKEGFLTSTYDRKKLWLGQTPQGCRMDLLYEVINSYPENELLAMTGTSQLFINKNIDVKTSLGSVDNFKITTANDISFAKFILSKDGDLNE